MPLIPGMRTSSIRQSALRSWSKFKNSSAEANTFTANPTDLRNPQRASRTDSSSSTIEIRAGAATEEITSSGGIDLLYLGIKWQEGLALVAKEPACISRITWQIRNDNSSVQDFVLVKSLTD